MRGFIISSIATAIALAILVYVLPSVSISGDNRIVAIVVVAVVFGIVNGFIKPVVRLLSFPITLMTLGLFTLVINGLMLLLTAAIASNLGVTMKVDTFPPDLSLGAFGTAVLAAIVLSVVRAVVDLVIHD